METIALACCVLAVVIWCMFIRECIDIFGRWIWSKKK